MLSLPEFFLPKLKHFGLSVGRASLRAVEMSSHGKVRTAIEIPFPDTIFKDGELVKKDIFRDLLKKLITQGKFTTPYVAVCFSEIYAYTRGYSLPLIPIEEIQEAVSWHVKDLFPFPEIDIYYDWKLLETHEKEYEIGVVAVPKKVLDPLVEEIINIGLKPLSFEPGASVIARLLLLKPHQQVIVTEINRHGAYVTLVDGEKALFTTVVNYAADETSAEYVNSITATVKEIAAYYLKKGITKSANPPIILSGEAVNEEVAKLLCSSTGSSVKIFQTQLQNPGFNKAFAVAVSKIKPPYDPNTINLLPLSLQEQYDSERANLFYTNLLIRMIIGIIFTITFSVTSYIFTSMVRQQIELNVKLTSARTNAKRSDMQQLLLLNAQARNIVNLAPLRKTPQDKLQVINTVLPAGITISQWEYDDTKLQYTLTGTADRREELLALKAKLEKTDEFTNVILPLGSLETPENIQFSITFVTKK